MLRFISLASISLAVIATAACKPDQPPPQKEPGPAVVEVTSDANRYYAFAVDKVASVSTNINNDTFEVATVDGRAVQMRRAQGQKVVDAMKARGR